MSSKDQPPNVSLKPLTLPGDCVAIPQVQNVVYSRNSDVSWSIITHAVPNLDIDGQGSPVVLVPSREANLYPDTMTWTLYLKRGDCGHELGLIFGLGDPVALPTVINGLRDLSTIQPNFMSLQTRQRGNLMNIRYRFDGTRYKAGKAEQR